MSLSSGSTRAFPALFTSSFTLTVYFRKRANQGTGSYTTWAEMPSIAFVFPNGINDSVTISALRSALHQHLLNNNIHQWWTPKSQDVETAITEVLNAWLPDSSVTTANVLFDGEFGPMLIS